MIYTYAAVPAHGKKFPRGETAEGEAERFKKEKSMIYTYAAVPAHEKKFPRGETAEGEAERFKKEKV